MIKSFKCADTQALAGGSAVKRYDNESSKGDHCHHGGRERKYAFTTPERLIADFQRDIARWDHENRHS